MGAAMCAGAAVAIGTRFAEQVLTPAPRPEHRVRVEEIEPSASAPTGFRVWLSGPDTELEGSYSFIFDAESRLTQHRAGHARLGPVVSVSGTGSRRRVAREVLSIERGELGVGTQGRITGWWFTGPDQLPYESRLVSIPLPGGIGWGWVIAPDQPTEGRWAVHVHGRGALPQETLRGVEVFAKAGFTSLVIAYRNDVGAPPGVGGRYGLGLAEQADVDAAIGWAVSQGADRVTLVGWSMGATASVLAAGLGRHASVVEAMVLDSPALDWRRLLRHQVRLVRLPGFIANVGMLLLRSGWVRGAIPGARGTDLSALTAERLAGPVSYTHLRRRRCALFECTSRS